MPRGTVRPGSIALSAAPSVVHAIPGRVRVRLCAADQHLGRAVANALAEYPDVQRVVWNPHVRSLTIHFDPRRPPPELATGLDRPRVPARLLGRAEADSLDWGKILMDCALALLPVGAVGGVAISLASSLIEERRRRNDVITRPGTTAPMP